MILQYICRLPCQFFIQCHNIFLIAWSCFQHTTLPQFYKDTKGTTDRLCHPFIQNTRISAFCNRSAIFLPRANKSTCLPNPSAGVRSDTRSIQKSILSANAPIKSGFCTVRPSLFALRSKNGWLPKSKSTATAYFPSRSDRCAAVLLLPKNGRYHPSSAKAVFKAKRLRQKFAAEFFKNLSEHMRQSDPVRPSEKSLPIFFQQSLPIVRHFFVWSNSTNGTYL